MGAKAEMEGVEEIHRHPAQPLVLHFRGSRIHQGLLQVLSEPAVLLDPECWALRSSRSALCCAADDRQPHAISCCFRLEEEDEDDDDDCRSQRRIKCLVQKLLYNSNQIDALEG